MSRLEYLKTIGRGELTLTRVREAAQRRIASVPDWLAWRLTPRARAAAARLDGFRNRHAGERCLIVANGPSLRGMDLSAAHGIPVIGMNRGYLLRETHGIDVTYLVVIDVLVQIARLARELANAPVAARFMNWAGRQHFAPNDAVEFLPMVYRPGFYGDVTRGIYGGHSVTYACLQLAYFLGFRTVILVGKDHNYAEQGVPGAVIRADGTEDNHFLKGYYTPGQVWRIPDYKGEEFAYLMARRAFEADGRRVIDATVNGRLDVFEKRALDVALRESELRAT